MTIEEQIAQLEAMRETLLPILKKAEAECSRTGDIWTSYNKARSVVRMRVRVIEESIYLLRNPDLELSTDGSMAGQTAWRDEPPMKAVLDDYEAKTWRDEPPLL